MTYPNPLNDGDENKERNCCSLNDFVEERWWFSLKPYSFTNSLFTCVYTQLTAKTTAIAIGI
jgi:hypothetical protein